jgi:hypothetical protein
MADTCSGGQISGNCLPLHGNSGVGRPELKAILEIAFGVIGAFALLIITVSGFRYITSGGNPEKTAKAKSGIVYSLVGLVVAITAEAIVAFVVNRL